MALIPMHKTKLHKAIAIADNNLFKPNCTAKIAQIKLPKPKHRNALCKANLCAAWIDLKTNSAKVFYLKLIGKLKLHKANGKENCTTKF